MKYLCVIYFIIAFVFAVTANNFPEEDNVIVLTDDNFEGAIQQFRYLLIEFCKITFLNLYFVYCKSGQIAHNYYEYNYEYNVSTFIRWNFFDFQTLHGVHAASH